jgi:hypothetical protein
VTVKIIDMLGEEVIVTKEVRPVSIRNPLLRERPPARGSRDRACRLTAP